MPLQFSHDTLIIDASCLINLYASNQLANILQSIPKNVAVAAYVADRETLFVYGELNEKGERTKEQIALQPLINIGLLHIVDLDSEDEVETLATFSALIADRGEAITGAIALHRNWAIIVDDKKARRLFQQNASHLQLIYTLELVKHWVELDSPTIDVITATLQNIRRRATYTPRRQEPLYDWWHQHNGG